MHWFWEIFKHTIEEKKKVTCLELKKNPVK